MKRTAPPEAPQASPGEVFWHLDPKALADSLGCGLDGLQAFQARERLAAHGPNVIASHPTATALRLLARQFTDPLVAILILAALISMAASEWIDAAVVLTIVAGSAGLGFTQEYLAGNAIERLRARLTATTTVLRGGVPVAVPVSEVVSGDLLLLSAGSLVPADAVVLEARDCFLNQAMLTGETFPVEKAPGTSAADAGLAARANCVFAGTSVVSGTARALVVRTGRGTVFGGIAGRLELRPPLTEFERGIRQFGAMLTRIMLVMILAVLAINVLSEKPPVASLLFALALAVGLAPELLPAIVSITLAHGARRMATLGVIVRRLNAIENLGSMDVLCTDKTGTLTEGVVKLDAAVGPDAQTSTQVMRLALLNARLQTGLVNPLDLAVEAGAQAAGVEPGTVRKVDEIPYDFVRKRLSVVIESPGEPLRMITKGALARVIEACATVRLSQGGEQALDDAWQARIQKQFEDWSAQGYRVLGVASREVAPREGPYGRDDERGMCLEGFLLFMDPAKPDAVSALADLRRRGVAVKIVTGDNLQVALHVARAVGLEEGEAITGDALDRMADEALMQLARRTTVFAEVDPNQKERIILALKKTGHVVGYMGDGINDALALHTADVGISVDTAVDVAKDAADFVLLEKSLDTLREGIDEGRRTFANTQKYVLTTISANFGNMASMAVASVFLPFLPLLASQILLNNFLSDIPAAAIAGDRVDPEWVERPRRWDSDFIRDYMVRFGLLSSVFDLMTFGLLIWVFQAAPEVFRTGWFVESLLTELLVALVVRTRRAAWRSRPGSMLLASTLAVVGIAIALPYLPGASVFGFVPLPASLMAAVLALTLAYVIAVEVAKHRFFARRPSA